MNSDDNEQLLDESLYNSEYSYDQGSNPNQEFTAEEVEQLTELRDQDRFLPIANVSKIMKKSVPSRGKIAKDAKETMQECVSEFISFITSEATERCQNEKRKTINGEDILFAMSTLGFDNLVEPLKVFLAKYREANKLEVNSVEENMQQTLVEMTNNSMVTTATTDLTATGQLTAATATSTDQNTPSFVALAADGTHVTYTMEQLQQLQASGQSEIVGNGGNIQQLQLIQAPAAANGNGQSQVAYIIQTSTGSNFPQVAFSNGDTSQS